MNKQRHNVLKGEQQMNEAPERIWRPAKSQRFKGKLLDTDIEYIRVDIAKAESERLRGLLLQCIPALRESKRDVTLLPEVEIATMF